jgi:hypothetical protein
MTVEHLRYIELPPHIKKGGFDHAAYHRIDDRMYLAHTANDAVDVIDCGADRYLHSISGLTGAAGVLTAEERDLVFTSNRAEDAVGIYIETIKTEAGAHTIGFDAQRNNVYAFLPGTHRAAVYRDQG